MRQTTRRDASIEAQAIVEIVDRFLRGEKSKHGGAGRASLIRGLLFESKNQTDSLNSRPLFAFY